MTTAMWNLCNTSAAAGNGVPVAYVGPGGAWRFFVRVAKPPPSSVLGNFTLGTSKLGALQWFDVTADLQGITIERGDQEPTGGSPGAGKITFRLTDQGASSYAPWANPYHGPGAIVQAGFYTGNITDVPGYTRMLCTGMVTDWEEGSDRMSGQRWVDITALETIFVLGANDQPAVAPVGAGDLSGARLTRIGTAASWQFGPFFGFFNVTMTPPNSNFTFQDTTLADDSWTELQLIAQSCTGVIRPTKTGDVWLMPRDVGPLATYVTADTDFPVVADSIQPHNDDDNVLTEVTVSRAGGTAHTYALEQITGRYQRRSHQFFNLRTQNPGSDQDLDAYAADRLGRGNQPYRVAHFDVDRLNGSTVLEFISQMDLGTRINVNKKADLAGAHGTLFSNYLILGYTIEIEPYKTTDIQCRARIFTEPSTTSTWSRY